jgi:hypothetical protein
MPRPSTHQQALHTQDIILQHTEGVASSSSRDGCKWIATAALPWQAPIRRDYEQLLRESEYAAWCVLMLVCRVQPSAFCKVAAAFVIRICLASALAPAWQERACSLELGRTGQSGVSLYPASWCDRPLVCAHRITATG